MPRLTDADYLANRHALIEAWEMHWSEIAQLPTFAQRDLHRFYAMSEDLYDDDALAHRHEAKRREPSLPQQAGRAFAQLERIMRQAHIADRGTPSVPAATERGRRRRKSVKVYVLARPEVDYMRLARALLEHARDEHQRDGRAK